MSNSMFDHFLSHEKEGKRRNPSFIMQTYPIFNRFTLFFLHFPCFQLAMIFTLYSVQNLIAWLPNLMCNASAIFKMDQDNGSRFIPTDISKPNKLLSIRYETPTTRQEFAPSIIVMHLSGSGRPLFCFIYVEHKLQIHR
jgi:hypothetical protein